MAPSCAAVVPLRHAGPVTDDALSRAHAAEAAYEPDPRRWRILGVSLVIAFMALLDVTIVNVALPSIQSGLGTTPATVQWVVSGYALAFGLTLVAGGRLGDAYGQRRLMLIGLTGFVRRQCRGRTGPERGPGDRRAPRAGRVRGTADAAELRTRAAALPWRRARPGLRVVRADGRDLVSDRAGAGRRDHRAGRRGAGLALAVPGEHPDRPGRPGRDPQAGAAPQGAPTGRGPAPSRRGRGAAAGRGRAGPVVPAGQHRGRGLAS